MLKTYHGSCHCGTVRYEADIDLAAGTGKCNCSICTKIRNWAVTLKPMAFRLLAGDAALSGYQFATKSGHYHFCSRCGTQVFSKAHVPELGGDVVSVRVATLDDAPPEELTAGPVTYANGRDNLWLEAPAETRHL